MARGFIKRPIVSPAGLSSIVDVGANVGYYSLVAAQAVGGAGHVWAFEPVPGNLALIRMSAEDNGYGDRIHVLPQAVDAVSGTARIYLGPEDLSFSLT